MGTKFFYRSEQATATKQYVLVYPSYQYVTTRQDESSNSGFFETIQNYFISLGNNGQNDESAQLMDAVEPDKPESTSAQSTKAAITSDLSQEKAPNKQKLYYSYVTPASTLPLNADRRVFFVEQPQIYSTYSSSAINPVFNLQPLPVLLSRSNQAVAQPDDPQPNKVITENVQKFSQIPPVMASIEQVNEVQAKSSVAHEVHDNSNVVPGVHGKSGVGHDVHTDNNVVPEAHAKSGVVEHSVVNSIVVDPLPESKVAPIHHDAVVPVEENRAIPVVTESSVEAKSETIVEARSNVVIHNVASESVAPIVATPVADGHVAETESVGHSVGASLKEAPSLVPHEPAVPSESVTPSV